MLAAIFFIIFIFFEIVIYRLAKKANDEQIRIKFTQIFDFLEEEISMPDSKSLTFTYLNKSLLNNVQYEYDELIGQSITDTNPDCEHTRMKEFIKPLINGEVDILKYETTRLRKDGSTYPIETTMKHFRDTNILVAFSQDITEEKEIDKVKSYFASIINHTMRTKLTSISGSLKIILSGMVGKIPITMQEMIDIADNNATKLLELIDGTLDIEKLLEKPYKIDFKNND